jgi:enoyl-CoA hydratase
LQKAELKVERESGIAIMQVDRPEVRNALDPHIYRQLGDALSEIASDRDIGCVIITGAGDKTFVSGSDIRMLNARTQLESLDWTGPAIFSQIEMLPKPVIAAVNGYALGAGCELALACDIRIASRNAKFGQPEVKVGILPGGGGTQRLHRIVGLGKAKELIFTGDIIDANEAYRIGLVNKVVESGELIQEAKEMAKRIMRNAPLAVRLSKMAINAGVSTDIHTGMQFEKLAQTVLFSTEDRKEGTSAFLEKRSPSFKGQ